MKWDRRWTVSRALTLQIARTGVLVARNSISRKPQEIDGDGVPVLLAFAPGRTVREAYDVLRQEWEVEEEDFAAAVETMVAKSLLTPVGEDVETGSLATEAFASVRAHHRMIRDPVRVLSYQRAIARHCQGRHVLEIGCGSGLLSIFAAQAGARRVTAVEETRIVELAREMLLANGCSDVVTLHQGNSRDLELDEPADIVIHELFGTDPFVENMLPSLVDARERLLAPRGLFIPYRVEACGVGFEVDTDTEPTRRRLVAEVDEYSQLYGIDASPLRQAFDGAPSSRFRPRIEAGKPYHPFEPRILTREVVLFDLDFKRLDDATPPPVSEAQLVVTEAGRLGGFLTYFRAHLDDSTVLATSPFSVPTHWGWNVRYLSRQMDVEPGQKVALTAGIVDTTVGQQRLEVDLAPAILKK